MEHIYLLQNIGNSASDDLRINPSKHRKAYSDKAFKKIIKIVYLMQLLLLPLICYQFDFILSLTLSMNND